MFLVLDLAQNQMLVKVRAELDKQRFHKAIEDIMFVANEANAYIDRQAPWTLKKEDPERMKTVLYVLAECIRCLGLIMQPLTPACAAKMLDQLKIADDQRDFASLSADCALKPDTAIDKPEGIFPRIVEEEEKAQAAG